MEVKDGGVGEGDGRLDRFLDMGGVDNTGVEVEGMQDEQDGC